MTRSILQTLALCLVFFCGNNHASAQCQLNTLSDEEFIRIIQSWNDPCFNVLYASWDERPAIIERLDDLIQKMDNIETDKDYGAMNNLFDAEVDQLIQDAVDSTTIRKDRKVYEDSLNQLLYESKTSLIESLMIFTELHKGDQHAQVPDLISYIRHTETLQKLYFEYEFNTRFDKLESHPISPNQYQENLTEIARQLNILEAEKYIMYQSNSSAYKKVKGIDLYHANDVFMGGGKFGSNQDREMTGAFKFEVSTDYFKARYLNLGWIFNGLVFGCHKNDSERVQRIKHPQNEVLSYQSLSFGGLGYTPYIRYRNNFALADTMHQHDRPFGSYVYVERSKYRLWPNGLVRHHGKFQIGQIGLLAGDKIQAKIHKDLTVESQRVYGWTKQIGNGGRYLIQVNHQADFLLFSTTNKYTSVFTPSKRNEHQAKKPHCKRSIYNQAFGPLKEKYAGVNVVGELDLHFGGYLTSFGTGIRFSTLDFIHSTDQKYIVQRRPNRFDFGWNLDAGIGYRYVQHSTMLEGLGYWTSFEKDAYDEDNPDYYVLNKDQINRHLWVVDWGVTLRWRQMTLYYRQTIHRMEYTVAPIDYNDPSVTALVNPEDQQFYQETIVKEHPSLQNRKFYAYGTVGVSWLLK